MAAAGYSNQQDSDLTFTANLQDNVSDVADQIQKKLQALGATKAQIQIAIKAVDQATEHTKKVKEHLKTIPKDVHVKIQAHAEDAHREIARIRDIAKKPIEIPLKIAHKLDDELHAAHEKIRIFKSNVAQTLMGMPLIGAVSNTWQQTGAPMLGAAAGGLGIGGVAGGVGAAAGGVALMQKSFDVNNQLQQSVLQLTAVIKDQAQASRDINRLSTYNLKTPFPIQDTRQAYTTLRSMGIPATSPVGIHQISDAAAATGRSQNDVALAAASAMRGDMSRLGGLGIPISTQAQLAARFPGQSPEKAISSLFNQQFGGAAAIQSQSFQGITTRLKDMIQNQLIGPGGQGAFSGVQGLAGGLSNKLASPAFQKDAGLIVEKVQTGVARLWQEVQKGVDYFRVNLEEPLKRVMSSVVEIGRTFSSTFGGVLLTGVKTLGEAFSSIIQPLSKFVAAHPLLVQMFAVMKAFQMLGMNKMASPFENFFKSINPLTFSVTGLIKSIGQLVMLAPKLAVLFTIKNMLDMHSATQALTDSFKKFGQDGGTAIDKLQTKLDLLSGSMGKSASGMKQLAAQVSNVAPGSVSQGNRANFALRGAENMAIMDQQGFGGQAHQMYLNQLKLDKNYTAGGADRAFQEVTQSVKAVSKALGIDLTDATKKTADALTMFHQELTKIGGPAAGAQGAGTSAIIQASMKGTVTTGALNAGYTNPAAVTRQLLHLRTSPDPEFLKVLGTQNVRQAFSFGANTTADIPGKDKTQLEGYRQNFRDYTKFITDYQKLSTSVGLKPSDIIQPKSSFARFFGSGISTTDINSPEKLAAQYTKSAKTTDDVSKAMSVAQQKSSQFQLQQQELGELQARVNQKFEIFQHSLVGMQRGIENAQLAMNKYAFSALRPLQREMERLSNATQVYQHNAIVPVQRAQEDWNHTMQLTQRRVEDVSFAVGKAQFNMDKWTQGLLTGEQATLDNLHAMDLYNKQLQQLQLQNMSMQAQLTRTTVGEGFKEVVSPMMGFSLQRQMDINQRRQQIAQLQHDTTFGEQHYQLTKAARGVRERTELPFDQRMQGVKQNLPVIDKALQQNRDLQDIQYKQSLHMRTLEDRMYRATVGARKFEDAQFTLSQKMFSVNQNLEDMQDNLTKQQLALQAAQMGARKYEDQLWKIQKPLTAVNIELMKSEKETQALDNVLNKARQIQGTLADAMNAIIMKPGSTKEMNDQLVRIAGIMQKQGLISKENYDTIVRNVHKATDIQQAAANRHVSIWKRAWDEISGDFIGMFTGQTWIKIYDSVKHGIESVFGHGAIGKILGNVGGVAASGGAALYGLNAARVGIQHGAAGIIDRLPFFGRDRGLSRGVRAFGTAAEEHFAGAEGGFGSLVGRAGGAMSRFSGIGDVLRAGAPARTLARPWLWPMGAAGDVAGYAGLRMMGLGPMGSAIGGKLFGAGIENQVIPGPISAIRRLFGHHGGQTGPGSASAASEASWARVDHPVLRGGVDLEGAVSTVGRFGRFAGRFGKVLGGVGVAAAGVNEALDIGGIVQHPSAKGAGKLISDTVGQVPLIGALGQGLGSALQGKGLGDIIGKIFSGSLGALGPLLVGGVKKAFSFLADKASSFVSTVGSFFGKLFSHPEKIGQFIGHTLVSALKLGIKAVAFVAITFPLTVIEKMFNLGAAALKFFNKMGAKVLSWIGTGIVDAASGLWHFFTKAFHKAVMKFTDGGKDKNIFHMGGRIIEWVVSGLWNAMGKILDWITSLPGWMLDKIGTVAGAIANFGAKIAEGILKGLVDGLKDFGHWLSKSILDAIPDGVKDFLGIAKPKFSHKGQTVQQAQNMPVPGLGGKSIAQYNKEHPGHAGGLDRVPHDDYIARLHKDETVLTAVEAHAHRQSKTTAHRATSITPKDDADMSRKHKGLRDWEIRVKEHHIKLSTEDDKHKRDRDNIDDYWNKLRIQRRDDYVKTTQNKFIDHYKWNIDNQKQNLQTTQVQQDTGWSAISSITAGWIGKVEAEIKKIDSDLGITIDKKGNVHAPAAHAHGGLVKGGDIAKGQLIRVGEEGHDEVVIPLAPHRRDRARSLIRQTAGRIGGMKHGPGARSLQRLINGGIPNFAAGGYVSPFPKGVHMVPNRVDMGWDFDGGPPQGEYLALGKALVTSGLDSFPGVIMKLLEGNHAGYHVFHGHTSKSYVSAGQTVEAGQKIGRYGHQGASFDGGPDHIEIGWANASGTNTLASPHYHEGDDTAEGESFKSFLSSILGNQVPGVGGGGAGAFAIPAKLKKLLSHPPFARLLKHGVAGKRDARVLAAKHRAWQHRIQHLGDMHAGGSKAPGAGGVTALPGGWFGIGASIDPGPDPKQTAYGGMSFAELLVAGANANLKPYDLAATLGLKQNAYGMNIGDGLYIRKPKADKMFKIIKSDNGSGLPGDRHRKIDLHSGIASAMGWHPNEDVEIHKAAHGGFFGDHITNPKGHARGTMLMFHPGAYLWGKPGEGNEAALAEAYAKKGYRSVDVNYPLGNLPKAYERARAEADKWSKKGNVFAFGESAGGGIASWLAAKHLVKSAMSVGGTDDLSRWGDPAYYKMVHANAAQRHKYSAAEQWNKHSSNLYLAHSKDDHVVPYGVDAHLRGRKGVHSTALHGDHLQDTSWWSKAKSFTSMATGGTVPFDGFPAMLHKDEQVVPARHAMSIGDQLSKIQDYLVRATHQDSVNPKSVQKIIDQLKHLSGSKTVLHKIHTLLSKANDLHTIAIMDQRVRGSGRGSAAGVRATTSALHADQGLSGSLGASEGGAGSSALIQREEATPHAIELKKHWSSLAIATASSDLTVAGIRKKLSAATGKKKASLRKALQAQLTHEHKHLIALRNSWKSDLDKYMKEAEGRGTGVDILHRVESDITGDSTIHSDVQDPALSALGDPGKALSTAAKALGNLRWSGKGKPPASYHIPGYAAGIDHVRHGHLARIHKGEAVIAANHAKKLRLVAKKITGGGMGRPSNLAGLIDLMHKQTLSQGGIWNPISHGIGVAPSGIGLDHLLGVDPEALVHHTSLGSAQYQDGQGEYYGGQSIGSIKDASPHSKLHTSNLSHLRTWLKHHKAHFAEGGVAARDGLAMLHKSEVVIPPGAKSGDNILKELRDSSRDNTKIQKDMSIRQIDQMVRGPGRNPLVPLARIANDWLSKIYRKPGPKAAVSDASKLATAAKTLQVDDKMLRADLTQARKDLVAINAALRQNSGDLRKLHAASLVSNKDINSLLKVAGDTHVTAKTHAEILKAMKETQKAIKEQGAARNLELKAHRELLKAHKDTAHAILLINHASHSVHIAQKEVTKAIRDTHKAHVNLSRGQAALRAAMHETGKSHAAIAKKHHDIAAANKTIHQAHLLATKAHHETTKALHDTAKAHKEATNAHKAATIAHHETTKALRDQTVAHHATTKALHDTTKAHRDTTKALHDVASDHRNIHRSHYNLHGAHVQIHGAHLNHAQYQTSLHSAHLGVANEARYHHQMTHYFTHRGAGHLHSISRGASSGYAGGFPNVPTNMIARLHAGETVLNPGEAQTYRATRAGTMGAVSSMGHSSKKMEQLLEDIHDAIKSTRPEIHVSSTATSPKIQTNVIHKYTRSK